MRDALPIPDIVGQDRLVARLDRIVERVLAGRQGTVFISGEAGIGKTALLRAVAATAAERGARTAWGTCIDIDGAAGSWPWTQARDGLVRAVGADRVLGAIGDDAPLLAPIVPSVGAASSHSAPTERDRLLAMDATSRFLDVVAGQRAVVVVLDDLQWADESPLALLEFVNRGPRARVWGW